MLRAVEMQQEAEAAAGHDQQGWRWRAKASRGRWNDGNGGGAEGEAQSSPEEQATRLLGLAMRPVSLAELKAHYHRAICAAHPDHGGSTQRAQQVNWAYKTLKEGLAAD